MGFRAVENTNGTDSLQGENTSFNFPFPNENNSFSQNIDPEHLTCSNCCVDLVAPFILCDVCNLHICLACFSKGAEFFQHKNDHNYRILSDEFYLFNNSEWTAKEESILLENLLKYGNWGLVAKQLPNRTEREVKEHYERFYVNHPGSELLPKFQETTASMFPEPLVPYRFRIGNTEDPPRYLPHHIGYRSLSGYNAARSDFEVEYDRSAEALVVNLQEIDPDHPHYDTLTNLQCAIIRIYNNRLKERRKRKEIIRNHGLICYRKMSAWLHRYDITITRNVYAKLIRFMQFYSGEGFEYLMEGLHRSGEIKYRIQRLILYRTKGISTLAEAKLYHHLQQQHEKLKKEVKVFQTDGRLCLKNTKATILHPSSSNKRRSGFTPIDIVGMPGYEKLSEKERELCKNVRLVPISYIEFKNTLVMENKKCGYLKLQTARKLLKIDVNKTRRLYDFLLEEGYIEKPQS